MKIYKCLLGFYNDQDRNAGISDKKFCNEIGKTKVVL